jgi:hypothetical protein
MDKNNQQAEIQQGITATYFLKSQEQALSAGRNCNKASWPPTNYRAKDKYNQQARTAARHHSHSLTRESRQASSAN